MNTTGRWFVATDLTVSHSATGRTVSGNGRCHAKEIGTVRTLCGIPIGGLHILWDDPFPSAFQRDCDVCTKVVALLRSLTEQPPRADAPAPSAR